MSRPQRLVIAGMAAAALATALLLAWPRPSGQAADAVSTALRCLLSPALCLAAGIGFIAKQRFFDPVAIDGSPSPRLEIAGRYLANTVEQAVLAAFTWLAFAATAPAQAAALLPDVALAFAVARALFWAGYHVSPAARAFGFGLTFYPSVALLAWTLVALALSP